MFDPNDKPRAAGPELDVGTLALLRKSDNLLKTLARRRLDSPTNAEEDGDISHAVAYFSQCKKHSYRPILYVYVCCALKQ